CLPGELGGRVRSVLVEVDGGECGEGLAFEYPVADVAADGQSLAGALAGPVGFAQVPVGGDETDEGLDLRVGVVGPARQFPRVLVTVAGGPVLAQALFDGGPGVQRVGFHPAVAGVTGQVQRGGGKSQGVAVVAGVAVYRG